MAGRTKDLVSVETESSLSKVAAKEVSKLVTLAMPWVAYVLVFGVGCAFHFILDSDDPQTIGWTMFLLAVAVLVLTGVTFGQSHARGPWGKTHTTLTTFLAGVWVCAATINGPTTVITGRLVLIGGFTIALTWNIRTVIRMKGWDQPGAISDPLSFLFGQGAERAGMPAIEATTTKATAHKVEGEVQLEQGRQVAEDLQRKVGYVESGIGLPPGSITASIDPDHADKAKVTISDPRVMKRPIAWVAPSRPGLSIADPLNIGLWQDLDEVEFALLGFHLQVMGQSGAGKSIGGAWNILAEVVTRYDVAVFVGDITKGRQTLGPLEESLHRFETTKAGVKAMIRELQARVKERTDYLASKNLTKWKQGCGLTYWLIWFEEFPDIYDCLSDKEQELFLSMLKAIRSAGGTIVLSLQRSDYSQMPTLARGQLGNMCFGVQTGGDASFGLSEPQQDAGARPELWSNKQPGMAYLDVPGIDDGRIAMPLRTYAWGLDDKGDFDDERANAAMRAHSAQWPAAAKPVDATTAALSRLHGGSQAATAPVGLLERDDGQDDDDEEVQNVAREYLDTDDPDPDVTADIDDEIPELDEGEPPLTFAPPAQSMTPEQRGAALMARLQELWDEGARDFSSGAFKPLWETTDISRAWIQKQLRRLVEAGVLAGYDEAAQRYLMPNRPEV